MLLYAETPARRSRQVAADVLVLAGVAVLARLGTVLHDLVARLAGPGEAAARAGRDLSAAAGRGGDTAGEVPLVGDALQAPFDALAEGGRTLTSAGVAQADAVGDLAVVLAVLVAGLPALALVAVWLPLRLRGAREATAAARLRARGADLRLFALRALVHRPLRQLRRVSDDPWRSYAAGEWDDLAALELHALGLHPPPPEVEAPEDVDVRPPSRAAGA